MLLETVKRWLTLTRQQVTGRLPVMDTKTFPSEEVAELFGVNPETLRNWRRLEPDHPRHLGATLVDGKYRYDANTIIEWMKRPENSTYREIVIASFVDPVVRGWFDDLDTTSANIH